MTNTDAPSTSEFPRSVTRVFRQEVTDVRLRVVEGALPAELRGHLFFVSPAGNGGHAEESPCGSPLLAGDGMIHRVDFGATGAIARSRLVKPPCFWADQASRPGSAFEHLGFRNYGLVRASPRLGFRNLGNTALLPMYSAKTGTTRLLACYDCGRPLEIDPVSLDTITPVGSNDEWAGSAYENVPFRLILSTAHPVWDARTEEMFSVNYRRSPSSLLANSDTPEGPPSARSVWSSATAAVRRWRRRDNRDFLSLVRWDGNGPLERWTVTAHGRPVRIRETMHQIGVTRDFVVLADTSFKVGLNQILDGPDPSIPLASKLLRLMLARRQPSSLVLYVIRRADLERDRVTGAREVSCTPVVLPHGAVHFLVDYENPNGQITIHTAHGPALDLAEWIRKYDRKPGSRTPVDPRLSGMVSGPTDVGRVGRYTIDAGTGAIVSARTLMEQRLMWAIGLYAAHATPAWDYLPERYESVFWFSNGFWPELLTEFVLDLYATSPEQVTPPAQIRELGAQGPLVPQLFRLDTSTMTVADSYAIEGGRMLSSPQFVPKPRGAPGDGWIIATVVSESASELWIFDARRLSAGPIAKLSAQALRFGFTLHSAWLPSIRPREADYYVGARDDHEAALQSSADLRALFRQAIDPHFGFAPKSCEEA